jgi:co-chaperonin GroES (HSP10)
MIKQDSIEEVTAGGIIIPDKARAKMAPARGEVIIQGSDNKFVKAGDKVMFSKDGTCFTDKIGNDEYVWVQEEDICYVDNRNNPDL